MEWDVFPLSSDRFPYSSCNRQFSHSSSDKGWNPTEKWHQKRWICTFFWGQKQIKVNYFRRLDWSFFSAVSSFPLDQCPLSFTVQFTLSGLENRRWLFIQSKFTIVLPLKYLGRIMKNNENILFWIFSSYVTNLRKEHVVVRRCNRHLFRLNSAIETEWSWVRQLYSHTSCKPFCRRVQVKILQDLRKRDRVKRSQQRKVVWKISNFQITGTRYVLIHHEQYWTIQDCRSNG